MSYHRSPDGMTGDVLAWTCQKCGQLVDVVDHEPDCPVVDDWLPLPRIAVCADTLDGGYLAKIQNTTIMGQGDTVWAAVENVVEAWQQVMVDGKW